MKHITSMLTFLAVAAAPFVAVAALVVVIVVTVLAIAAVSWVVEWALGPTLIEYGPRVLGEAAWRLAVAGVVIWLVWLLWNAALGWRVRTVWGAVSGRQPALAKRPALHALRWLV